MENMYEPTISEGVYPSDGGWTKDNEKDILLLSIPEFGDLLQKKFTRYQYAWLYDKQLNVYIFCFQLDTGDERAVIFHAEHAGILLKEEAANNEFQVAITDVPFERLTDETSYILFPNIELKRESIAGW